MVVVVVVVIMIMVIPIAVIVVGVFKDMGIVSCFGFHRTMNAQRQGINLGQSAR